LIAVSYRILARWRKHFCQVLNVHRFIDVRQTEIQTSERLVPVPSAFEVEVNISKLKRQKSPGTDQLPAELIKAGAWTLRSKVRHLMNSTCNKEESRYIEL